MNVVGRRIAVNDLDGLAGHYAEDVRMVLAAALIEGDGFLGNVESASAEAFFHVHKHVGEVTSTSHYVFSGVRAFAGGILAHVNRGGLWRGALALYNANDRCRSRGINGSGSSRGCRSAGRGGLLLGAFLFAASREEDKAQLSGQAPNCDRSFLFHVFAVPLLKFESSNQMIIY